MRGFTGPVVVELQLIGSMHLQHFIQTVVGNFHYLYYVTDIGSLFLEMG